MSDDVPFIVEQGWVESDFIDNPNGPTYRLLTYPDGVVRFEHRCDRGARGVIICAPALCIGPHAGGPGGTHTLHRNLLTNKPTVWASVLCDDCGTHGFITEGRWSE